MGLAEELEKRLERVVEGFFSKAFRSAVQPAEIGRRLLREQEGGKSVSVGAVYVPNHYIVSLSTVDYERFAGLTESLTNEFASLLRDNAKERKWKFPGAVSVRFQEDASTAEGRFHVAALHEHTEPAEDAHEALPSLVLVSEEITEEWSLDGDITIGRLSDCDVVLTDTNASRLHARVVNRDDEWWVIDAGSTNGTLVNEALIKERRLTDGDVIQVGTTQLKFVVPTSES